MKYSKGDLIIYGETGVCRVLDIVKRQMPDGEQLCYKLEPVYQNITIYTSVENESVFTRPILTREAAESLVAEIPTIEPEHAPNAATRELTEKYDSLIKRHDCRALVSLTKHIYQKRNRLAMQKKKLSAVDERYIKKAEELLFGELAAALGIERGDVVDYIAAANA